MNGSEWCLIGFLTLALLLAGVALGMRRLQLIDRRLHEWAQEQNLRILNAHRRYLFAGPFILTTGKWQAVFRVKVQQSSGAVRSGWVRIGDVLVGLLSKDIEVRWDDEPREMMDYPSEFPGGRR